MALRSDWKNSKEEVVATNGIVTAMQPPSAEAGLAMLAQGGNAVDAAVAMGFCNVVLEPYMAVIGGMGYMLVHLAKEGRTIGVDFNGRAPRRAHPEMFEVTGPAPARWHQRLQRQRRRQSYRSAVGHRASDVRRLLCRTSAVWRVAAGAGAGAGHGAGERWLCQQLAYDAVYGE